MRRGRVSRQLSDHGRGLSIAMSRFFRGSPCHRRFDAKYDGFRGLGFLHLAAVAFNIVWIAPHGNMSNSRLGCDALASQAPPRAQFAPAEASGRWLLFLEHLADVADLHSA